MQRSNGSKCIFKLKEGIPWVKPSRYKTILLANGFTQRDGIHYDEILSLMAKHSIVAHLKLQEKKIKCVTLKDYSTNLSNHLDNDTWGLILLCWNTNSLEATMIVVFILRNSHAILSSICCSMLIICYSFVNIWIRLIY